MNSRSVLESKEELLGVHELNPYYTSGFAIGIIAVNLIYPKLPGNVANATTYPFPVLYRVVDFEIEELFRGSDAIKDKVINAAKYLEQQGVRAIIGACGYFAHFQEIVREAVDVPVYLSSLCQLPFIKMGLKQDKKIAVLAASADNIDNNILSKVGSDDSRLIIANVGSLKSFYPIRYGETVLDNAALTAEICDLVQDILSKHRDIGAILLECSDLPPYAKAIQSVSGLPVFDFNSMIDLIYHSVVQKEYFGYF